jgi:hypothetical protein
MSRFKPPGQCPVCHEFVPKGAAACHDCGACPKSGWNLDEASYDGTDLPDDSADFDYDDFIAREFGSGGKRSNSKHRSRTGLHPFWRWVALLLLVLFVLSYLRVLF